MSFFEKINCDMIVSKMIIRKILIRKIFFPGKYFCS